MLEVLRYFSAAGAGHRGVVVPGWLRVDVTLPRRHLVNATRVELGQAHKCMGLK